MRADCYSTPHTLHSFIVSPPPPTTLHHLSPMILLRTLVFHFKHLLHTLIFHLSKNSHFTGCKLWSIHSVSFFYQFVELGVHRHTRIRTVSYIQRGDSVTLCSSEHTQPVRKTHIPKHTHNGWIDLPSEKISQSKMPYDHTSLSNV